MVRSPQGVLKHQNGSLGKEIQFGYTPLWGLIPILSQSTVSVNPTKWFLSDMFGHYSPVEHITFDLSFYVPDGVTKLDSFDSIGNYLRYEWLPFKMDGYINGQMSRHQLNDIASLAVSCDDRE